MKLLNHKLKERTLQDFRLPFGEHSQGIPVFIITARTKPEAPSLPPRAGETMTEGVKLVEEQEPRDTLPAKRQYRGKTHAQTNCIPVSCPMPKASDYSWERTRANSGISPVPELLSLVLEH